MSAQILVAAIQLDSQDDEEQNWQQAEALCRGAARNGARVIVLPENMLYEGRELLRKDDIEGLWKPRVQELARELGAAIACGSLREGTEDEQDPRSYNTLLAFDSEGVERGRYRKIHLFDIDLPEGPRHLESSYLAPGTEPVCCELPPLGKVGLSICYDLRFPELYRGLASAGARTFLVPSSFTKETGRDHWLPLLQARAIENQCFVIAPNQCGRKGRSMHKYGRSMILDPWGTVLACAPDRPSYCLALLDFKALEELRRALPVHEHTRLL